MYGKCRIPWLQLTSHLPRSKARTFQRPWVECSPSPPTPSSPRSLPQPLWPACPSDALACSQHSLCTCCPHPPQHSSPRCQQAPSHASFSSVSQIIFSVRFSQAILGNRNPPHASMPSFHAFFPYDILNSIIYLFILWVSTWARVLPFPH